MTETDDGAAGSTDGEGRFSPKHRAYLRRLAHGLAVLVVLVAVIPFVVYAVPQVVGAEHSYVVLSGSMEPALSPGDVTIVDDIDPAAIDEGDVITYLRDGESRTTTHRVVEVVERDGDLAFRTKGDANEDPDQGVVAASQVRGRLLTVGGVPVVFPFVGYVIQFANTQTGFALLFVVPMVLLVGNEIWRVVTSARTESTDGDGASGDASESDEEDTAVPSQTSGSRDRGGVTFRPAELRLAVLVLVAFVGYSGAMAVLSPGVWTIGVAASTAAALVLLGGLYLRGLLSGTDGGESSETPHEGDGVVVEAGPGPDDADDVRRRPVSSLESLVDLASVAGGRIRRDPTAGTFSLTTGETAYVYSPDAGGSESPVLEASDATSIDSGRSQGDGTDANGDSRETPATEGGPPTEADDD